MKKYCEHCEEKTEHIYCGFSGANRRIKCEECNEENEVLGVWD